MKKKLVGLIFILAFVFLLGFPSLNSFAEEPQEQNMVFNYVFKSGTKNTVNNSLTIKEENVKQSKELKTSQEEKSILSFHVFNNSFFSNENHNVLENELLNFKVNTVFETNTIEIKNDLDEIILSTSNTTIAENLQDGNYTITYIGIIEWVEKVNSSEFPRKSMITATIPLVVHKTNPEGKFVKSRENNYTYFTWENENWSALLDGNPYLLETWIETEGLHKIELTNGTIYKQYEVYIDHYYLETSREDSNCEREGKIVTECSQCGVQKIEVIPKLEHRYNEEVILPTCSERGGTLRKCELCGKEDMTNISYPLGHRYTEELVEATCTEKGGLLHKCTICSSSYMTDVIYPSGHSMIIQVVKSSTCEESGIRKHTCEKCDLEFEAEIPALNHTYEITNEEIKDGITTRTYTCKTCGKTYVQDLGNQYDKVTDYIIYLFDAYSPYMLWIFLATTGIWSLAIGIPIIIAYRNEEKAKAKKMLISYGIGLIVIFVIIVACPFLVRGIAYLVGH